MLPTGKTPVPAAHHILTYVTGIRVRGSKDQVFVKLNKSHSKSEQLKRDTERLCMKRAGNNRRALGSFFSQLKII